MQERKKRGTEYREDLYIRKLIILTFLTLLFVLSVFISALGRQHDPSTGDYTGTSDNGSPETTAVWVTTAGEGAEDLPGTTGVLETTEPPGPGGSPETTDTPGTTSHNAETSDTPDTSPDTPETTNPDVPVPTRDYIPKTTEETKLINKSRLNAGNAILVDLESNTVLASYHADYKIYPASMTKIMTLIVAAEMIDDLNATFTITQSIIDHALREGASRAKFEAGETVTILDLMYGAALPSGADATSALAIYVAGSEAEFAKLMNKKAEELGLTSTRFANASGLHHPDHYSTVREIAAIMAYAMDNPLVAQLLSTKSYTTSKTPQHPNGIALSNTGFSSINNYSKSDTTFGRVTVTAVKTGYTGEAGNCLATYGVAEQGKRYILITALGTSRKGSIDDCTYVYGNYT
ncbi:MAG: serine hydrolase [Eubacteriales bacterium]|jgi:D-alanyl-D-alanine carboxypeptidase (penicillin-binding protein 5/6)